MQQTLFTLILFGFALFPISQSHASLNLQCKGRLEVAPIGLFLKLKEPGNPRHLTMGGARIDASLLPFEESGFLIRPALNLAYGKGNFWSTTLAFGYCIPLEKISPYLNTCPWDRIKILPSLGIGYSRLHAHTDVMVPTPVGIFIFPDQLEKFHARSFFIGIEGIFKLTDCLYTTLIYQYGWSRTHTSIGSLFSTNGHSSGSSYAIYLDYFLNDSWAISSAFLYNESLDKDRFGILGIGCKLGIGYYF